MKRTCVQCGNEFELTNGEIDFYKSKHMSLPKRCKACRDENKQAGAVPGSGGGVKRTAYSLLILLAVLLIAVFATRNRKPVPTETETAPGAALTTQAEPQTAEEGAAATDPSEEGGTPLQFRTERQLQDHFERHGADMGCATAEAYLAAANAVVANPRALQKTETDDGDNDRVYFLEETGEIVFVSEDGYIRTYYSADKAYFDKQ